MRTLLIACILFIASPTLAQFKKPLCDDGMGGYTPCIGVMDPSLLPVVPISRGGTGATGTGALLIPRGRFFGGNPSGIPGFQSLARDLIPGISFDFSATPAPIIDVTKILGDPALILRVPGSGGAITRVYAGSRDILLTFNASTSGGDFAKDTTSATSTVYRFRQDGGFSMMSEPNAAVSTWNELSPTISQLRRWGAGWLISDKVRQLAIAGGEVCGGAYGDEYHFPVQWPIPYENAPASATTGADIYSFGTNVKSVSALNRYGALLTIRNVNSDLSKKCVSWVGYVASN